MPRSTSPHRVLAPISIRATLALVTAALATAAATARAQTAPTVQEFVIPRANAFPHDPAFGPDGVVWYTDQSNSYIGRFDPGTQAFTDWPTPTPGSGPHGLTVAPDGYVWYTGQRTGRIGRVDPQTGAMQEHVLPANASRPHTPLWHLGAVWFTDQNNYTYGRLDPSTGMAQVWNAPSGSLPYGIAAGPDGALWIALFGTNKLGRVDPTSPAGLQLFDLPHPSARPRRLAVGNDGLVWYTDFARGYLGRLDPTTRAVVEWRAPASGPYGISLGTDGRVWFHAQGAARMSAFDPATQQLATYPIPTSGAVVRHMVTDVARGRLWLALSGTRRLGLVDLGPPVRRFGTACAGAAGTPQLVVDGVARIGTRLALSLANTTATSAAVCFGSSRTTWGGLPLPIDLTPYGAAGCSILTAWDVPIALALPNPLALRVPIDAALRGTLWVQGLVLGDPVKPVVTSDAAELDLIGL